MRAECLLVIWHPLRAHRGGNDSEQQIRKAHQLTAQYVWAAQHVPMECHVCVSVFVCLLVAASKYMSMPVCVCFRNDPFRGVNMSTLQSYTKRAYHIRNKSSGWQTS